MNVPVIPTTQFGAIQYIESTGANGANRLAVYTFLDQAKAIADNNNEPSIIVTSEIPGTGDPVTNTPGLPMGAVLTKDDATMFLLNNYNVERRILNDLPRLDLPTVITLAQVSEGMKRFLGDIMARADMEADPLAPKVFNYIYHYKQGNDKDLIGGRILNIQV